MHMMSHRGHCAARVPQGACSSPHSPFPPLYLIGAACDIPPLSRGGQSQPGSIRGANTEALMHNAHIHIPNKELLYEFLSYKRDT
jgi:hypothetical protein